MTEPIRPEEGASPDDPAGAEVSADPVQQSGIQIDGYTVKARIVPARTGDPIPKSWSEVWRMVNAKLMSIAFNLVGLVDDIIVGSRKLVRGLTTMPRKAARRVERSHAIADRVEAIAQEKAEKEPAPESLAAEAADRIESLILRKQAEGYAAEIVDLGDGRQALVFVKPEERALIGPLIRKALPAPAEAGGETSRTIETLVRKVLLAPTEEAGGETPKKSAKRTRRKKSDPES
jgi:hypothetical protein